MGYGELQACVETPIRITFTEQLKDRKNNLEGQLKEVNDALDALAKNPELQSLVDIISKVRY